MSARKQSGQFKKSRLGHYVALLWHVMRLTTKGYRRHSLRHTGVDDDRRSDKLRAFTVIENDKPVVKHEPYWPEETKLQRAARQKKIGVRYA